MCMIIVDRPYFKNACATGNNSWANRARYRGSPKVQDDTLYYAAGSERSIESYPSTQRMWDPDQPSPNCCWQDFDPLLQRLSPLDQLIVWLSYHEYYNQVEIAGVINCSQSTIHIRLVRIKRLLKILHEPSVTFADLEDTNLRDRDKFFLCMYSQCLGNYSAVARRLQKPQPTVWYVVNSAKRKLNGHPIGERLKFGHKFIISPVRGDPPPVRS